MFPFVGICAMNLIIWRLYFEKKYKLLAKFDKNF